MFCYIDPFDMNQQIVKLTPNSSEAIFNGTLSEASAFMATEYNNGGYERIVLKGTLADNLADEIRSYSKTKYGFNNIEIEVIK